jgi:hypothetical protein
MPNKKTNPNYKAMLDCDEFRIIKFPDKLFLVIGEWRDTRTDSGGYQWFHNGEPIHFRYLAEKVIASGRNEKELFASAREYKRISKLSMDEYLQEQIGK